MKPTSSHMAVLLSAGMLIAATLACTPGARSTSPTSAAWTPVPSSTSSGGTTGGGGSINDIVDPCHLLDQADAAKLFGHPANPGKSNFGSNSASCTYTSGNGDLLAVSVNANLGGTNQGLDQLAPLAQVVLVRLPY